MEVPAEIVEAFGAGKRAPVVTTINGYSWRSRVAAMRGQLLIGISTANRAASGISLGEEIEVELTLDEQPREVTVPDDLAAALQKAKLRTAFDALAYHTPPPATRIDAIGGRRETPGTGITDGSSDIPTGGDPPPR